MHLNPEDKSRLGDGVTVVKEPPGPTGPHSETRRCRRRSRRCSWTSSSAASTPCAHYAERLDGWIGGDVLRGEPGAAARCRRQPARGPARRPRRRRRAHPTLRRACSASSSSTSRTRSSPASSAGSVTCRSADVGAYLPAGRFPLLASAFMTVGVARGGGRAERHQLHPAQPRRRTAPRRPLRRTRVRSGAGFRHRRRPGPRGHGLRPARRPRCGHAGGSRERLRGRGKAPAVRAGRHRRARRAVRGRGHRRRDGHDARWSPPTCSARPSTARLARLPGHHLGAAGRRGARSRSTASCAALSTREIAGAAWREYGSIYVVDSREKAVDDHGHPGPRAPRGPRRRPPTGTSTTCSTTGRSSSARGRPSPTPTRACPAPTTSCRPDATPGSPAGCRSPASSSGDLPAGDHGLDPGPGAAGGHHLGLREDCQPTVTAPSCGSSYQHG